jgi:general secretion pathway protein A
MYQAYWGLSLSPFRGHLDPRFFHEGPPQEEALARLHFLVEERRTLGLLLGESGGGRSMVMRVFASQLGSIGQQCAVVSLGGLDAREFYWQLITTLGVEVNPQAGTYALARAVADHITANRFQQLATVMLLDDADLARGDVLEQVLRLAQFDVSRDARLTLVLSAQVDHLHKLSPQLLDLADLRIDLESWEEDDTVAFLKSSLAQAGRSSPVFSEQALTRLHQLSAGIPRRVKQLADLALLAGAGRNLVQIEADTVDSVYGELGLLGANAPARPILRR